MFTRGLFCLSVCAMCLRMLFRVVTFLVSGMDWLSLPSISMGLYLCFFCVCYRGVDLSGYTVALDDPQFNTHTHGSTHTCVCLCVATGCSQMHVDSCNQPTMDVWDAPVEIISHDSRMGHPFTAKSAWNVKYLMSRAKQEGSFFVRKILAGGYVKECMRNRNGTCYFPVFSYVSPPPNQRAIVLRQKNQGHTPGIPEFYIYGIIVCISILF